MIFSREITIPIRLNLSWYELWEKDDQGLIRCWERGREKAEEEPSLSKEAQKGRLVVLPWKGGLRKQLKIRKYGSFNYLAMWQGLRGESLFIDKDREITLTCSHFNTQVTYTSDITFFGPDTN